MLVLLILISFEYANRLSYAFGMLNMKVMDLDVFIPQCISILLLPSIPSHRYYCYVKTFIVLKTCEVY